MNDLNSITSVRELRQWRQQLTPNRRIGFVPTMGALHLGHGALVKQSQVENDLTVVSVFVNPTQFNDAQDFALYPQPLNADLEHLKEWNVNVAFVPNAQEIYADDYRFEVQEKQLSQVLCGPRRPGHFTGMLTVVLKLLNLVRPTNAYFGEKDFQQLQLIREMASALFLETEIKGVPTVREADGLALSSRNRRLSADGRRLAPKLHQILKTASSVGVAIRELADAGFRVEYVEEHWGRRFAAAYLDEVRLIDNVEI